MMGVDNFCGIWSLLLLWVHENRTPTPSRAAGSAIHPCRGQPCRPDRETFTPPFVDSFGQRYPFGKSDGGTPVEPPGAAFH